LATLSCCADLTQFDKTFEIFFGGKLIACNFSSEKVSSIICICQFDGPGHHREVPWALLGLTQEFRQLGDIAGNPPRLIGHDNQALSGSIDCSDFSRGWPMQAGRPFSRNSL
jgi:hypothetical protein